MMLTLMTLAKMIVPNVVGNTDSATQNNYPPTPSHTHDVKFGEMAVEPHYLMDLAT